LVQAPGQLSGLHLQAGLQAWLAQVMGLAGAWAKVALLHAGLVAFQFPAARGEQPVGPPLADTGSAFPQAAARGER